MSESILKRATLQIRNGLKTSEFLKLKDGWKNRRKGRFIELHFMVKIYCDNL